MLAPHLHQSRHGLVVLVEAAPDLSEQLAALHPEEQRLAAAMKPIRQREWVAGRTALRAALREARFFEEDPAQWPLLKDDRGAPLLPAAALGSISHKGDRAAALVAPRAPRLGLGLDLELVAGPRVDISQRVLTARELAELTGRAPEARASALALRFSLKEAVYKAIDPWVRRYVGFREVELLLDEDAAPSSVGGGADHGRGRCLPVTPELQAQLGDCALEVSWSRLGDYWLSTARAER